MSLFDVFIPTPKVKKFLFQRLTRITHGRADQARRQVVVAVEAFDKDHAIQRLSLAYPFVRPLDWDFVDELDATHDLGMLGETLKLTRH